MRRLARAGVFGSGAAWRVPLADAGWVTARDAGDALLVAFRVNTGALVVSRGVV